MKKLFISIIIFSPFILSAQGFQVNLQGQKQQAMGGTGSAMAEDGSSLFFNPGAASFLKNNTLSVGVSPIISKTSFTETSSGVEFKTNSPAGYPFNGYLVMGKKESKFKFGIASYTPFGSAITWQNAWTGRFVITGLKLSTVYIQPTISYKISEKLGIGGGLVYGLGKLNLNSDMPMQDENGNYSTMNLQGKGSGYGFNAGVYFKPTGNLSFGINYRSQLKLTIDKGEATFTVPVSMRDNFPSGPVSTTLNMPQVMTIATAFKPSAKVMLAFDATMVGWKSYDTLNYDFEKNTAYVSDTKLARHYRNTFSYRIGAEYAINSDFSGRIGLKYLSSPVQNGYVTPEVPDANHFSYSAGFGYKINSAFSADASFTYEHIKRSDTNAGIQLSGLYETNLFIPGLSLSYSF